MMCDMDHIAIMKKSWKLIDKILTGDKRIESRWYMSRFAPWNRIRTGDTVYFKDSGAPVTAKAEVEKVMQYENFSEDELKEILKKYGGRIRFVTHIDDVFAWAKKRKYCILIFLKKPQKIQPFKINKEGFGNACAWMCVDDIKKIKAKP